MTNRRDTPPHLSPADTLGLLPSVKRQVFCVGDRLKMDEHKAWATTIVAPKSVGLSTTKAPMKPTFRVSLTASLSPHHRLVPRRSNSEPHLRSSDTSSAGAVACSSSASRPAPTGPSFVPRSTSRPSAPPPPALRSKTRPSLSTCARWRSHARGGVSGS